MHAEAEGHSRTDARSQEGLDDALSSRSAGRTPSSTVEFSALPIPPLTVALEPLPTRTPHTRWAKTALVMPAGTMEAV
jgi:hypothetical protein